MRTSKIKASLISFVCCASLYFALPTFYPQSLSYIPDSFKSNAVNLGLDLRGGASILMAVGIEEYLHDHMQQYIELAAHNLRHNRLPYSSIQVTSQGFNISLPENFSQPMLHDELSKTLQADLGHQFDLNIVKNILEVRLKSSVRNEMEQSLITQSMEIMQRRVDELGIKEVDIQRQGQNGILIQVPGLSNPDEVKKLLGQTAKLSFHLVEDGVTLQNLASHPKRSSLKIVEVSNESSKTQYVIVRSKPLLTGEMLVDAQVSFNTSEPVVSFKLDSVGSKIFGDISTQFLGKALAILLDGKVLSAPVMRERILGGSGVISGHFSIESANELALLLRSGALPVPLSVVEERVVGPTLGTDSIEAGSKAVIIGAAMVCIFMALFYGIFGLIANFALIINIFAIVSCLSLLGATLTLPGIAGIVLTLGMAVDANVLICERIKEELRHGKSNVAAIQAGYTLAFRTILDANITSLICALILYLLGSGSVKSFAISFIIGIFCSVFTAVSFTKLIVEFWYRIARPKKLLI